MEKVIRKRCILCRILGEHLRCGFKSDQRVLPEEQSERGFVHRSDLLVNNFHCCDKSCVSQHPDLQPRDHPPFSVSPGRRRPGVISLRAAAVLEPSKAYAGCGSVRTIDSDDSPRVAKAPGKMFVTYHSGLHRGVTLAETRKNLP